MQHGTCLVAKKKLRPQREGHTSMSSELGNTIYSHGLQQGRKSRPPHGLGSQSALCTWTNLGGQQHLDEFGFTRCKEEQQDGRQGNKGASFGSASIGDDEVARDNGLLLQGRSHAARLGLLCGNRMESPWPQQGAPWVGYSLFKAEKPSHVDKASSCITGEVAAQGNPIAAHDIGDSMNTFCVDAAGVVQSADLGRAMCNGRGTNKSAVACVIEGSDSANSQQPLSGEFPDLIDDRACSSRDEQQEEENSSVTAEVIAAESLLALDVLADAAFEAGIQDSVAAAAAAASTTSKAVFVHGGFPFVQKKRAKSMLQQELGGEAGGKLRRSRRRIIPGIQLGGGSKAKIEECSSPIARSKRGRARLLPSKFQDSVLGHWKKKKRRASAH